MLQVRHNKPRLFTETADAVALDEACMLHRMGVFVALAFVVDEANVEGEVETS
jgi:hypothetical protein